MRTLCADLNCSLLTTKKKTGNWFTPGVCHFLLDVSLVREAYKVRNLQWCNRAEVAMQCKRVSMQCAECAARVHEAAHWVQSAAYYLVCWRAEMCTRAAVLYSPPAHRCMASIHCCITHLQPLHVCHPLHIIVYYSHAQHQTCT